LEILIIFTMKGILIIKQLINLLEKKIHLIISEINPNKRKIRIWNKNWELKIKTKNKITYLF